MKSNLLIILLIITTSTLTFNSCKENEDVKNCNCTKEWNDSTFYYKDDLVLYKGKCWIAVLDHFPSAMPGPWLQNGNDVWVECKKD